MAKRFEADDAQRRAIEHVNGPMLVIAGAGTGKTTVLTRRIAHLIGGGHARADEILALTYTTNSAADMRVRVRQELSGADVSDLKVTTFHEYCNDILYRHGKQFDVLDDADLHVFVARRLRELGLKRFVRAANVTEFLSDLLNFTRRCQDELVSPEKYAEYVRGVEAGAFPLPRVGKSKQDLPREEVLARCNEISQAFIRIEQMLREKNLGTFGHMITFAYDLLLNDVEVLERERKRARFVLFDEFQDANLAQIKVLQLLAGESRNAFVVGDPDQAIYRFRGASSEAFELFQRHFPEPEVVRLERNRRSTTPILLCAHALIAVNPDISVSASSSIAYGGRKPLISAREEEAVRQGKAFRSDLVDSVAGGKNSDCIDIVSKLKSIRAKQRGNWSDFAILYRSHAHRNDIVAELAENGIPFSVENMDVLDTAQIRDILACLRLVLQPNDWISLLRLAALPQFGIVAEQLRAALRGRKRDEPIVDMAATLGGIDGGTKVVETVRLAAEEITKTRAKAGAALEIVGKRFGLDMQTIPARALLSFARGWEKKPIAEKGAPGELIEYFEYFREAGGCINAPSSEDADAVKLMTAHSAKGLEFDTVFLIRANSNSFPSSYKEPLFEFPKPLRDQALINQFDDKEISNQEERRLFYVALTRAKNHLTIYSKPGTGKEKSPSGYMRDLLTNPKLKAFLQTRVPKEFQTDMFGGAEILPSASKSTEWLRLPPATDLSARLSASSVQTYEKCPLQFKLERDWRLPTEVSGPLQYGAAVHRVLLAYYLSVKAGRTLTEEAMLDLFRTDLAAAGLQDPYQHELYEKQGIRQLKEFHAAAKVNPVPDVLHTEEWFEVSLGDTVVTGRIDRMDRADDGIVITDYKTGKPQSQEDADDSLQLAIYAFAAQKKWGYDAKRLVLHNLEGNDKVVTQRTSAQLDEACAKIKKVAHGIAEGNFEPKPSMMICKFCAYKSLCPATEKKFYDVSSAELSASGN